MNFDDFNISFDIDSEIPTYEPVDNFNSHDFGYKPKKETKSNSKIKNQISNQNSKNKINKKIDDSNEEEDDDDAFIPKPKKLVRPIMSGQFDPFTHFFITITKAQNLDNCSNRSLFLKIRVHPSIPIIESPCVWCSNRDAIFNVAYSLDFTKIPPFNLGDFTPVVEMYRRFNSSNELIAVTLLPLKAIKENMKCGPKNRMLTYLYRETPVMLKDLTSGSTIGSMKITIAFGFIEHEPLLDPNISNPTTPNYFSDANNLSFHHPNGLNGDKNDQKEYSQGVVKPNILPIQIENISQNNQKAPKVNSNNRKAKSSKNQISFNGFNDYDDSDYDNDYPKHRHSRHRRHEHGKRRKSQNKGYNWVDEAISLGWKPPGTVEVDWKSKARSKGWKPPNEALTSDIGVYCDPNGNNMKEFRSTSNTQTEPEITGLPPKKIVIPKFEEEEESVTSSSNDAFNDIELFELLNPKLNKKQKQKQKTQKENKNKNKKGNASIVDNYLNQRNELLISEPQSFSDEIETNIVEPKTKKKIELNFVKCVTLFEEAPNVSMNLLDDKSNDSDGSDDEISHQDIQQILNKISQNSNLKSFKQNSTDLIQKITDSDDDTDDDNDVESSLSSLDLHKEKEKQNKNINNEPISQILLNKNSNLNSITPIDNDEIKQSVSSIMISDSDSDNENNDSDNDSDININANNDLDISSDSDIEHINNLAKKDQEFFDIYNKYMNL